ncbi:MAG TPA: hypothetical protein VFB62_00140 [Polyangiaceae bacterium]|nr:hypothetical protein [Polyangiaceae bacterium]
MAQPPMPAAVPGADPRGKPARYTFIVVVAIVLTAIGILTSLGALVTSLLSKQMMSSPFMPTPPPGAPPEMTRALENMQQKMQELAMPWLTGSLAAVQLGACIWGLFGALALQKRKAKNTFGPSMLMLGVVELASMIAGLYIQIRTASVLEELVDSLKLAPMPPGSPDITHMMRTIMQISMMMGIAIALGWGTLKIIFFFYARHYASKPEMRAYVSCA